MSLHGDWAREDALASGTVEASAEERLARNLEVEDALAAKGAELGITGPWTSFSPAECRTIAAALDVAGFSAALAGAGFSAAGAEMVERLRLKAVAGGAR